MSGQVSGGRASEEERDGRWPGQEGAQQLGIRVCGVPQTRPRVRVRSGSKGAASRDRWKGWPRRPGGASVRPRGKVWQGLW